MKIIPEAYFEKKVQLIYNLAAMLLKYLRKNVRTILIGTLVLIIPAFVFLYGWSKVSNRGAIPHVIAKVGKTPITWSQYQVELQKYASIFGKFYSADFEKQIKNQVWEGLIQQCLFTEEATKRKISVSDDEVIFGIREYFKNDKGQFDSETFSLISNRDPERINLLEENVRAQIIFKKLRDEITALVVDVSEDETYQYFLTSQAEAKIKYISIDPEDLRKNIEVSKDELIEYYEQNKASFKDGPWRKIEYILIDAEQTGEGEINTVMDEEKEQILKDKAFNISLKLLDEGNWRLFAEKEKLFYGTTGYFSKEESIKEFNANPVINQAAFSVKLNEVSESLKIENGYVILRPFGIEPQYEDIADKIQQIVEDEKIKDLASRQTEEILSELQKGKTAEEIARNYSVEIKESKYFSRQGFIEGIGSAPEIIQAAFSSIQDKWAKVDTFTGKTFIIQTIDVKEPLHEKFQDEKENIRSSLLLKRKQEFFIDWAKNLREKNKDRIDIFWDGLKTN